jgi:cytoskeletal protein RodZ
MDMREIEQLHAQYAQPALTIDISPSPARPAVSPLRLGTAMSGAGGDETHVTSPAGWVANPRALWAVVFVIGAAAMFLIGSSIGKRDARAQISEAAPAASASPSSPASAGQAPPGPEAHEWPVRNETTDSTIAAASTVATTPASAADTPKITLPKQEPAKAPSPSTKSASPAASATMPTVPAKAQAPAPSAQGSRPAISQQAAPSRDIKLF